RISFELSLTWGGRSGPVEMIHLSCKVQGSVSTVTWSRDGSKLVPDHNQTMIFDGTLASLNIDHCSEEDSGVYECEAQSEAGSDQTHCHVRVQGQSWCKPPSFTKTPAAVEGVVGKEISLYCEFCGSPPFTVSWYKDQRPLQESHKYRMVTESRCSTLHVMALQHKDEGVYECRVSNNVDTDTCRAKVSLRGKPRTTTNYHHRRRRSQTSFPRLSRLPNLRLPNLRLPNLRLPNLRQSC
uniref:Ig-like domain-containing protein n=1 Tax=Periophthalmus magnuspinnatus TaxID=409849 RepID=A0A3B4ABR6_9GOBI